MLIVFTDFDILWGFQPIKSNSGLTVIQKYGQFYGIVRL